MAKVKLTDEELRKKLASDLDRLSKYADSYDTGDKDVAVEMATVLRRLLYDADDSSFVINGKPYPSLLRSLQMKSCAFLDTQIPAPALGLNLNGYSPLVSIGVNTGAYIPHFDALPNGCIGKSTPFFPWWNNPVIIDGGDEFSRGRIIKEVSDQEGAHVDTEVKEDYYRINNGGLGWRNSREELISSFVPAVLRQITHEALRTLIPAYPVKRGDSETLVGTQITFTQDIDEAAIKKMGVLRRYNNYERNEPCWCPSGKKYKKCHGK